MSAKKVITRDSVVSKTARASRGIAKIKFVHKCKDCLEPCEATMCFTETGRKVGMKWICANNHREATHA